MKRALKIIGLAIFFIVLSGVGYGLYKYQTDPMLKAIVDNDESILYYFPVKEMEDMNDLNYTETVLTVEDSVNIYTYYFEPTTKELKGYIFFLHGAGGNVSKY